MQRLSRWGGVTTLVVLVACGSEGRNSVPPTGPLQSQGEQTLTVTVDGPSPINANERCTFWAFVSGGTPPYTYDWGPSPSTSGPEITLSKGESFRIDLLVTDANGDYGLAFKWVDVRPTYLTCMM